jgi:DNA-binding CsgD family transcriptional regulator
MMTYRWRPPKTHLSPREQEILKLAAQGQRVNQIARSLWLSPHTVRNHLKNAYRVLHASDLAEALLKAIERGDISLSPADSTAGHGEGKV